MRTILPQLKYNKNNITEGIIKRSSQCGWDTQHNPKFYTPSDHTNTMNQMATAYKNHQENKFSDLKIHRTDKSPILNEW